MLHGYVLPREIFLIVLSHLGLSQWVEESTFLDSGNVLDLVFATKIDRVDHISMHAPFPRCQHCPVGFEYVLQFDTYVDSVISERLLWCKGNYKEISIHLRSVDWEFMFEGNQLMNVFNILFFCKV